jgi:hypothetical protein
MALVGALAVIAWGSVVMTVAVVRRPTVFLSAREPDLRQILRAIDRRPPRGTVRVRSVGGALSSLFPGIVNELDRRGVDVRVDPRFGRVFGDHRTVPRSARVQTWFVTEVGSPIPVLRARDRARVVASLTPLPADQERELRRLQARVGSVLAQRPDLRARAWLVDSSQARLQLRKVPGIADRDLVRLAELNALVERSYRCRCAIVAVPPARASR